ncbi:hypothetical protein DPMN_171413 [Dreissena polymorpha]|uniref:Uncharacterized protein n=1 Tax=Dreissena polymorpha TaxID=45954 RepID=A0A9D4DYW5_DREPO|nr:hypothetical protein DPMN_171413 [Dreissena polymorpha]
MDASKLEEDDHRLESHVAIFLERVENTNFPTLSRKALLEKYSVMSLEVSGKPTVDKGEAVMD